jgi:hypothetical protein
VHPARGTAGADSDNDGVEGTVRTIINKPTGVAIGLWVKVGLIDGLVVGVGTDDFGDASLSR